MAARRLLAAAGALQHCCASPAAACCGRQAEGAAKGSGELLVYVKTDSETVPVTVDAGGTVGCLTEAAAAALRLDSGRPVLLLKGQRLDSGGRDVPLADCGVSQEECLTLCPTAFSCIAHREAALSVDYRTDGSIVLTALGSGGLATAYFDPLLSTDSSAEWFIEVPLAASFMVGVTALSPAECDEVLHGCGSGERVENSGIWAYDDDGAKHCVAASVQKLLCGILVSMTLTMHGRTLAMRAVGDIGYTECVQDFEGMELPANAQVRFFACVLKGSGLRVKMEER
eukprot:TRINITY_DN615_c0_g1_i5.p1 TRINITY_DN615_c0_g1~~TRINITY_DN615_c0_g1_i5.p1  ORF type:complete len:292 (+),score=82.60 TRINITY_DN615_c0_g1_i5:24-878(+)